MTNKYRWGWMKSFNILSCRQSNLLVSDSAPTFKNPSLIGWEPTNYSNNWMICFPVFKLYLVGAARTRAPAATNYDVHAPRRKMLGSPAPQCNGEGSPRPLAILTTDRPRPGKYMVWVILSLLYIFISDVVPKFMGQFLRPFVSTLIVDLFRA